MQLYEIYPIVEGEFTFPLTPEPVSLQEATDILHRRMSLLLTQGYWRNCRGEQVPLDEVGFKIVPATHYEDEDEDDIDEAGQLNGAWHP
jgi:hypothetical protein